MPHDICREYSEEREQTQIEFLVGDMFIPERVHELPSAPIGR